MVRRHGLSGKLCSKHLIKPIAFPDPRTDNADATLFLHYIDSESLHINVDDSNQDEILRLLFVYVGVIRCGFIQGNAIQPEACGISITLPEAVELMG